MTSGRLTRAMARLALVSSLLVPAVALAATAPAISGSVTDVPLSKPSGGPRPDAAAVHAWQARKFGLFIHFGLYSMLGGIWDGKRIKDYSEQIERHAHIPTDQYDALARQFDPTRFDPDAIVALAKAAGMRYIILTAKHHDGFAMFHTAQNDFNIVDATPYGRDVVKALAGACARAGMPFGVYYSTIDWHYTHDDYVKGNNNPISPAQADFNMAQIKELMSHYGPISEFWFDMGHPTAAQSARFARAVHKLQPQTMISGRVWHEQGDFATPPDNRAPNVHMEVPWEEAASIFSDTWGYRSWQVRTGLKGKIHENIRRLVSVVSAGGNYLLNIGPKGNGSVVPYEAKVLRGIGAWLKPRSRAIYATHKSPFKNRRLDFGYATVGRHTLYLFVEKPPADGVLKMPGVVDTDFGKSHVLDDSGARVGAVKIDAHGAMVKVDGLAKAGYMPVVALPFSGSLHVRPRAIADRSDGNVHLDVADAEHFLNDDGYDYSAPHTLYKLRWYAAAGAGDYTLTVHYRDAQASARMDVWVDGHHRPVTLAGGAGTASVRMRRDMHAHPYAMEVELTPVAPFYKGDRLPATIESVTVAPAGAASVH